MHTQFKSFNEGRVLYSISLTLSSELLIINRKTDSLFDWLGDWGGFKDGLTIVVEIIIEFYQIHALKV